MTDLASFLLARYEEESFVARAAGGSRWAITAASAHHIGVIAERKPGDEAPDGLGCEDVCWWDEIDDDLAPGDLTGYIPKADHIARHNPARVLADIEAKRRIVNDLGFYSQPHDADWTTVQTVLRLLALPYASHEDYQPEWKP